ncbi:MAG: glutamate racemase [Deltaproteobacteria bacterium]|nr:glutamate racemase [Deltaproteobacteria bacterium]
MNTKRSIGIFDSGIGGLTVLHSIIAALPHENTIYVGDTARVPYGTKSAGAVTQYSLEISKFLNSQKVKALVVACNTASAVALPKLKEVFNLPVIDMIGPAARKAARSSPAGKIGIIGTEGTIRSGAYEKNLKEIKAGISIISSSCPLFVPLAEEGWTDNDIALMTATRYLQTFKESDIDTLILGCTHYPLFKETIRKVMGHDVVLVDSGEEAACELKALLKKRGEKEEIGTVERNYFVTDTPDRFLKLGKDFLGQNIDAVSHLDIP